MWLVMSGCDMVARRPRNNKPSNYLQSLVVRVQQRASFLHGCFLLTVYMMIHFNFGNEKSKSKCCVGDA